MEYFFLRPYLHYFLHLLFPAVVAYLFFRKDWKKAYLIMLATMIVDADHVLSNPIFAPDRASINFHPLHTYWAIIGYVLLLFWKGVPRIIAVGLLLHMITDWQDYQWLLLKI